MMFRTILVLLGISVSAFYAEKPSPYALLQNYATYNSKNKPESIQSHRVFKREVPEPEEFRPVYRAEEQKNEGRARIEPVRPKAPVVRYDEREMLADQPPNPATDVNKVDNLSISNYGYGPVPSDVAYPDVPYAPGYNYDAAYSASNNYNMYGNNYADEPDVSPVSLLWNQVPDSRTVVGYMGTTIVWMFRSAFIILFGSFLTVAVCTYTNICNITFNGIGPIREEMRSFITPEKIGHAADFVKTAVDKYQKIQKISGPGLRK